MFQGTTLSTETRTCPDCGSTLQAEGELQSCPKHGLFFSYGPRLLVHVAEGNVASQSKHQPLMPWQTLSDK